MATITGINVGTTTITATYGGKTATASITVGAIAPALTFTVNSTSLTYNGSAQKLGTVSYNGDGTVYYIVSTSNTVPAANASGWTVLPANNEITYTDAGTYYVHLKATEGTNYTAVNPKLGNSTGKQIAKRTVTITEPSYTSGTISYDGTEKTIASGGSCTTGGTMYYYVSTSSTTPTVVSGSEPGAGWTTTDPTVTDKGTYYVWYYCYVPDTNNYTGTNINTVKALSGTKSVSSRVVTITAPVATDREYNGSNQTIFTEGSCTAGGVMYYSESNTSFNKSTWSTTIPYTQKSLAGTYTIYWYCLVEDTNNNTGTGINTKNALTANIISTEATLPTTWSGDSVEYHNTAVLTASGYSGGTLKYRYDVNNGTNWTETNTAPTRSDVGTTAVQCKVVGDANHSDSAWSSTVTLTVYKADDARMTVTPGSNLTYNGSTKNIATASDFEGIGTYYLGYKKDSQATAESQITWGTVSTSPLTATNAGTYYIYYKFTPDGNHDNVNEATVGTATYVGTATIAKAARSGAVSCDDVTYGSTVTATVSGNTESGGITWSITNGTGKATIDATGKVTPTQAGTVTVNATVVATANYDTYIATPKTITIAKAAGSIVYSTSDSVQAYCRTDAVAADTLYGDREITITSTSASGATGTISYGISQSGWSISNDGKTITVPDGTTAGVYNITVSATSAESTNYLPKTVSNSITVNIIEQALERIELTLAESTIPFNGSTEATVVAVYTNGAYADVTSNLNTSYSSNPTGVVTITK